MDTAQEIYRAALRAAAARGELVLICGAGVSSAISGNKPTATWIGLIEDGLKRIASFSKASASEADSFLSIIRQNPSAQMLLAAAEWLRGKFDSLPAGEYKDWLKNSIGQLEVMFNDVPQAMSSASTILTTSYDHLLEEALARKPLSWSDSDQLEEFYAEPRGYVFHLHGHFANPKSVVFGGTDYGQLLSASMHARVLKRIAGAPKTLLMVGFGAGLDDPNFRSFVDWFNKELEGWTDRLYVLLRDDQMPDDASDALKRKIAHVGYGASYDDLPLFLDNLLSSAAVKPEEIERGLSTPVTVEKSDSISDAVESLLPTTVVQQLISEIGPLDEVSSFQRELSNAIIQSNSQRSPILVMAVTGTGKTTLARLAMNLAISSGGAAVSLLPTKALVAQEVAEWESWADAWQESGRDISVYGASRDYPEHDSPVSKGLFDIAIAIYEKLGVYIVGGRQPLRRARIVVVDELQTLVEDRERASKLEALLTMIQLLPDDLRPAIMGLSASLSSESTELLQKWLGVDPKAIVSTNRRPIPLDTYVMDAISYRIQRDAHLLSIPDEKAALPPYEDVRHEIGKVSGGDNEVPAIRHLSTGPLAVSLVVSLLKSDPSRRILVFVPGRTAAQEVAEAIQRSLSRPPGKTPNRRGSPWLVGRYANPNADKAIAEQRYNALQYSDIPLSEHVMRGLRQGVAYHSARLPAELRRQLEREFRDPDGVLRVLVATDTLAIGVNLPADAVIATSISSFSGAGLRLATPAELDNKAGRAGRRGHTKRARGEFYVLVPERRDLERVNGVAATGIRSLATIEGVYAAFVKESDRTPFVKSKFTELDDICRLTLQILCSDGFSRRLPALQKRIGDILSGLLSAHDPEFSPPMVEDVLSRLKGLRLIGTVEGKTGPSRLGSALGRAGVSIEAAPTLERLARLAIQGAGDIDLLYNTFRSREMQEVTAWVSLPKVDSRHYPSLKENIITYALAYCGETEARRQDCAQILKTGARELPQDVLEKGSQVVSSELLEILAKDAEDVSNEDATALLRAIVGFEWSMGVPFGQLKARFSSAIRSDEVRPRERPVELKLHYSDVEQLCEQAAGTLRGATDLSYREDGLDYSSRVRTLALQVEVGLPAWLAPVAKMRLPQLHRNRLSFLWDAQPLDGGWTALLDLPQIRENEGISDLERSHARRELELRDQRERLHRHRVTQEWASLTVPGLGGATFEEIGVELEEATDGNRYLSILGEIVEGIEDVEVTSPESGEGNDYARQVWTSSIGGQSVALLVPNSTMTGGFIDSVKDLEGLVVLRTRLQASAYTALSRSGTLARFVQPEQILSIIAMIVESRGEGLSGQEVIEAMLRVRVSALDGESWSLYNGAQAGPPPFSGEIPEGEVVDTLTIVDEEDVP